jgi:hypothetical protein
MSASSSESPRSPGSQRLDTPPDGSAGAQGEGASPDATASPLAAAATSQQAPDQRIDQAGADRGPTNPDRPRKGPLSFLSGALTSGLLAWFCLWLSRKVVGYYAMHPPHYEARVAQSIATALKTMIVGMSFLATFSFAFVGLGLFLVFLRSLLPARPETPA